MLKTITAFHPVRLYSSEVSKDVAVIKLPFYVKNHIERVKQKESLWRLDALRKIKYRGDLNVPVISSTKKELNFYLGQVYNKHFPIPLMSRYWLKAKSSGQKFTINAWSANPSLPMKIKSEEQRELLSEYITEFSELKLCEEVLNGIEKVGFQNPTPFQCMAIPPIVQHKNVMCIAETGCGKTMSYIIPIMHHLVNAKKSVHCCPNTPLAIVIAPGRELTEQIADAAYPLGESCGISVKALVSNGTKHLHLVPRHDEPFDILVASFGTLGKLVSKRVFSIGQLQHLVLDEADTLLDDTFFPELSEFLKYVAVIDQPAENDIRPFGTQLVLSSTTEPRNAELVLTDAANDDITYETVRSPYRHKILPHIAQKFWRVNNQNRAGILLELVKSDFKKKYPVIIFCNKALTCDWLNKYLEENEVPNVKYHAAMRYSERTDSFQRFQRGDVDVICCTDLASRGLDTQRVKHVINFDFPNNISDYILRIGRVGRVGSNQGHVTNLVVSVPGVHVVQDIEMAVRKAMPLTNVDANIKKKIRKLYFNF